MSLLKEGLAKMQRYCTYQERCHSEVRTKLINIKIYGDLLEEIISELVKDDFLNEQRFAETYAGGKFRIKKWGRQKILQKLKAKRVSEYCIKKGMAVIDEDDYKQTLESIIEKFYNQKSKGSLSSFELYQKCLRHCQSKGYEYSIIKEVHAARNQ